MFWRRSLLFWTFGLAQLVLAYQALQWLLVPGYAFPEAKEFKGLFWYNPYAAGGNVDWVKANFQVQSRRWGGLTNGRNNSPEAIRRWYADKNYGFLGISDYMSIRASKPLNGLLQVPCYEHGYNVYKVHHVLLGPHKGVDWVDWPLWQDLNAKQWKTKRLAASCSLLCLAHPSKGGGFEASDFRQLSGFRLMEVRSSMSRSFAHWDSALSAGRAVFLLFNDDAHDLSKPKEPGFVATLVPHTKEATSLWENLSLGRAVGFEPAKAHDHSGWDTLQAQGFRWEVRVENDAVWMDLPPESHEVLAYGQGGKLLDLVRPNETSQEMRFDLPKSGYLRLEIGMKNGDRYWLNPLIKTKNESVPALPEVPLSLEKTWKRRGLALLLIGLMLGLLWLWMRIKRYDRRKKNSGGDARLQRRQNLAGNLGGHSKTSGG